MRLFFLGIAIWNTLVAIINTFVLTRLYSPEVISYITPKSQILPIVILLMLWLYAGQKKAMRYDIRQLALSLKR